MNGGVKSAVRVSLSCGCVGVRGDVMFRLGAFSGEEDWLLEQCDGQR